MTQTRVVNRRREPFDVYIGRGSRWGNPYTHLWPNPPGTILVHTRDEAIACYREHLWNQYRRGEVTRQDLAELHGKALGCYCAPKPCHGDVLLNAASWAVGNLPPA